MLIFVIAARLLLKTSWGISWEEPTPSTSAAKVVPISLMLMCLN